MKKIFPNWWKLLYIKVSNGWKVESFYLSKFIFFKKATKIEKNLHRRFDTYLVLKRQIDSEVLVNFCGLLRKHEL